MDMADFTQEELDAEKAEREEIEGHGSTIPEANAQLSSSDRLRSMVPEAGAHAARASLLAPGATGKPILHVTRLPKPDGTYKTILKGKKTDWISRLIYLDGKPFDFTGRDYLKLIYNAMFPKKILKFARQSEKSTFLANEIIISSVIINYYKTLYVSPSHLQTRQFSNGKLKPWTEGSPLIKKHFITSQTSAQVFERGYANGAINFLRSAFLTADRARGITAMTLCIDELQDILTSNIPVLEECLSHTENPIEILSGTPKTLDGPMETYFNLSSACEWLVPCHAHSPPHYNFLDERCLGKTGPICNKCGSKINPAEGKWIAFNRNRDFMGFRVSQLQVPWMYQHEHKWKELLWKFEHLSRGTFYNECLGLSYDSASKPMTRADLVACCSSQYPFRYKPDGYTRVVDIFMGVDWGSGADGTERGEKGRVKPASYTVVCLGTYIAPGKFHIFYYKRFEGAESVPSSCVPEIIRIGRAYGITCIGADFGFGWCANEELEAAFSERQVIRFQHVGMQKERKKYDPVGRKIQLSRTEVMSDFISSIKKGDIIWPEWETVKDFLADFEHIYAEYSASSGRVIYDHRITDPDDAFHASVFCREAADNFIGIIR